MKRAARRPGLAQSLQTRPPDGRSWSTRHAAKRVQWWLLFGCVAVAGCGGTRITQENCDKILVEMPRAEVERILGAPDQSYQGILTWRGSSPEQRITIVLDEERRVSEKTCEGFSGR